MHQAHGACMSQMEPDSCSVGVGVSKAARWRCTRPDLQGAPEPALSDQVDRAVAVVTVHRSKGLEYPVVICPYLWQAPRQETGPLWRETGDGRWLIAIDSHWGKGHRAAQQAADDAMAEAERLAYVAMTRARTQLLVVWVLLQMHLWEMI